MGGEGRLADAGNDKGGGAAAGDGAVAHGVVEDETGEAASTAAAGGGAALVESQLAEPKRPETPDLVAPGGREVRRAIIALILMVPVPAISVALAMAVPGIKGEPLGKVFYFGAKIWTLLLPVTWLLVVDRGRLSLSPAKRGGLGVGALLGAAIFAVIMLTYWMIGRTWIDPATVRAEAVNNGIGKPLSYVIFVCGLSLTNSLMEEYVWRWFVFRKCEALVGSVGAVFLGAGLFTLHHIVALRAQMGWDAALLGSAGCFFGGVLWSWLYLKYRSIWPGYVAHVFADAAIYIIGWWLIFGQG